MNCEECGNEIEYDECNGEGTICFKCLKEIKKSKIGERRKSK